MVRTLWVWLFFILAGSGLAETLPIDLTLTAAVDSLPSRPGLPDPLVFEDGRIIKTRAAWGKRRQEILAQFHRWMAGTVPPAPQNLKAEVLEDRVESGARVQMVKLSFGPDQAATLTVELLKPRTPGPHPVFMTQWNHRAWALVALSRGWAAAVYAGSDGHDDTAAWPALYPESTWSTLVRRAWGASRVVDWLAAQPDLDAKRIALTGHSRNGKQSLYAAAMDERISAVVVSSAGQGGSSTFREFSEAVFGEGIETITRHFPDWYHPNLKAFIGREDRLPLDVNDLIACVAPRACLLSVALNDPGDSMPAVQHAYLSAQKAWRLLGAPAKLRVLWRRGAHETRAREIERYVDWFDLAFGRGREDFAEILPWPEPPAVDSGAREPARALNPGGGYGSEAPWQASLLGRADNDPSGDPKKKVVFGEYISGDLYRPRRAEAGARLPLVIYLPPPCYAMGYVGGYAEVFPPEDFLKAGFAVFSYDPIGSGSRLEEVSAFYRRYPGWSLERKMAADVRAALEALQKQPGLDLSRVYLAGYGQGGKVAQRVLAADQDKKFAGGMLVCADLAPDTLAQISPRPLLWVAHARDRFQPLAAVREAVRSGLQAYAAAGAAGKLELLERDDSRRFTKDMQAQAMPAFLRLLAASGQAVAALPAPASTALAAGTVLESWEFGGMKWDGWDSSTRLETVRDRASQGQASLKVTYDLARYAWPVVYTRLEPAWDLSAVPRLMVDVYLPASPTAAVALTLSLAQDDKESQSPEMALKPGWNPLTFDLSAGWLDQALRSGSSQLQFMVHSPDPKAGGSILLDNLRTDH